MDSDDFENADITYEDYLELLNMDRN